MISSTPQTISKEAKLNFLNSEFSKVDQDKSGWVDNQEFLVYMKLKVGE